MKTDKLQIDSLFFADYKDSRRNVFLLVSLVFHLLFFVMLNFITTDSSDKFFIPDVISVDLTSVSAVYNQKTEIAIKKSSSGVKSRKKLETKNVVSVSTSKEKKNREASKSLFKKMKMKHSLKKETYNSSKIVQTAIKNIKENIGNRNKESISSAISNIKKKVSKQEARRGHKFSGNTNNTISDGKSNKSSFMKSKIDIYKAELNYKILQNWVFSKQMAEGRDDWVAQIGIRINKNGTVEKIWFHKRSGNNYYDNSCEIAVKKSEMTIPALPEGYHVQDFIITFTPLDI